MRSSSGGLGWAFRWCRKYASEGGKGTRSAPQTSCLWLPMPLSNGAIFAGYTIQRELGSGAMGEVYLAQHPRLPRLDALKILPESLTVDAEFRERFNREADLAATLWHPNIIGLHDRGEFDGQLWIAMDYVEGTDAGRLLREQYTRGMPEQDVLEIVVAVAGALDYAHQRRLLHRDVKPANILLTKSDADHRRILLADFGIARRIDDISGITATNMAVGSVAYAAPEQLMGESMDGRADQYALAATAFHLLAGAPPFVHSNPAVVISRHLNAAPAQLGPLHPEFARLDAVLTKGLAKNAADRYPTCLQFARALGESMGRAAIPEHITHAAVAQSVNPEVAINQWATQAAPIHPNRPIQPWMPAPFPYPPFAPPRKQRPVWVTAVVPLVMVVLLLAAAGFAATQVRRPDPRPSVAAPQWQPYVDYAKQFSVWLTSLSPQTADGDIQRIIDGSTGQFRDDFTKNRSGFKESVVNANVTTQGTVNSAALESISGSKAYALVATTTNVTNNSGASQDPRRYRLRVAVEKVGDDYKVSNVEFVT
jgi:serine/threonine protein kinase, bacterial